MDNKKEIVDKYKKKYIDKLIAYQPLRDDLVKGLESVLNEEKPKKEEYPVVIGDIHLTQTRYHVGGANSGIRGSLKGGAGKILLYLLKHVYENVPIDELKRVSGLGGDKSKNTYFRYVLRELIHQLGHSKEFEIDLDKASDIVVLEKIT